MGLVRRDQLVALIECGVYEDDQYFNDEDSSTQGSPSVWTPKPGVGKSPLMHLAYHITDDRYDHMEDDAKGGGPSTSVTDKSLSMDEYDSNAWLLSVRRSREHLDCYEEASTPLAFGDDSLPPLSHGHVDENVTATVGLSRKGNVYIKWLHPACKRKYVTIGAVVNRGSICVNDFCPVSKARQIFTAMGLRHLIVLGDGGRVVGILTRINFLNEYIEERTRCFLSS